MNPDERRRNLDEEVFIAASGAVPGNLDASRWVVKSGRPVSPPHQRPWWRRRGGGSVKRSWQSPRRCRQSARYSDDIRTTLKTLVDGFAKYARTYARTPHMALEMANAVGPLALLKLADSENTWVARLVRQTTSAGPTPPLAIRGMSPERLARCLRKPSLPTVGTGGSAVRPAGSWVLAWGFASGAPAFAQRA